jgi:AraC-like DNA-binding protein
VNLLLTLVIGFSVVSAGVLYTAYAVSLHNLNKSPFAMLTGALLLLGLAGLQLGHLAYVRSGAEPLDAMVYRFWLFLTPPMFYLFGRSILFDERGFRPLTLLHLVPVLLIFLPRIEVSISILFCIGTGYSLWLTHVIYTLRRTRPRSRFELFFLVLFSLMAAGVLILGFSLPYMDAGYFYTFYGFSIGLALVLVVGVLLSFPGLLTELAEAARLSYATSTLNDIDVAGKKRQLELLMGEEKVYQQEELNLASLAESVGLGAHQLSELINTEFGMSFSRYVREYRIREAQRLLKEEADASILSISMEVGFRSQSNFYAAFKEITGRSPGSFRSQAGAD